MLAWKNTVSATAFQIIFLILMISFATASSAAYQPDSKKYAVTQDSLEWYDQARSRRVPVEIYAPDPAATNGKLPVVVFSPGFGETQQSYAYLGRYLARNGYITVVVDHIGSDADAYKAKGWAALADASNFLKRPGDLSFAIDRITASDQSNRLLRNRIDASRIGVAGHSMGSTTALALAGLSIHAPGLSASPFFDRRVRATVVLSPQVDTAVSAGNKTALLDAHSWDTVHGPVLLMTGSRDYGVSRATRSNPTARHVVFERLTAVDVYYMNINNAAHHAFSDTEPFYPGGPRDPRHHGWIGTAVAAFFDAYLSNDASAKEWLQSGAITKLTDGEVQQEQKTGTGIVCQAVASKNTVSSSQQFDFAPLTTFIDNGLRQSGVSGAGMLIIDRSGRVIYEKLFGGWSEDKAVPIASASKWWAAATIMTLVDKGLISLDDPVAKYLPEFRNKGKKSEITVRQTLAFTTGYPHHIAMQDDPTITQADLVRYIADMDLQKDPGTAFIYGGLQMEIAGRIAEVVTGKPYRQVFEEQLLKPLGANATRIANMVNRNPKNLDFESQNPLVPGGIVTNLIDYRKFIQMLLNQGVYNGKRILSQAAVSEMMRDQTAGVPIVRTAQEDNSYRFSLGAWYRVVNAGSNEVLVSAEGALGTSSWINLKGQYGVVFITMARASRRLEFVWRLKDTVTEIMNGKVATASLPTLSSVSRKKTVDAAGIDQLFNKLDKNKDQQLERDEIPRQMTRLNQAFERLDRDHNGRLSTEELAIVAGLRNGRNLRDKDDVDNRSRYPARAASATSAVKPLAEGSYRAVQSALAVTVKPQLVLHDAERDKDVQIRITYPGNDGPYPVIIFSHYSGGTKDQYAPLIDYWVSHGYVCIQPDHSDSPAVGGARGREARRDWNNRPLDISFIIDSLHEISQRVPELRDRMDDAHIGVGGHYLGAYTANLIGGMKPAAVAGSEDDLKDSRVSAIVALSPQGTGQGLSADSWLGLDLPMLVMTGSGDVSPRTGNTAQWRTEPYQYSPPGDKYLLYVEGLTADYGGILGQGGDGGSASPVMAYLGYTQIATTAFWDAYLKSSKTARQYLRSHALETGSGGVIELSWK